MIYGSIKHNKISEILNRELFKDLTICCAYNEENNLIDMETGSYEIDGKNIFVNVVSYETTTKENRFWEAHRKYLDVHFMLKGSEKISLNFIENLEQGIYDGDKDFLALQGDERVHVILGEGDFLICYPEDAHMTALINNGKESIKKAIFKIMIR